MNAPIRRTVGASLKTFFWCEIFTEQNTPRGFVLRPSQKAVLGRERERTQSAAVVLCHLMSSA
jgi:hypothetical protein